MNQPVTDPHVQLLDEARHAQAVADRSQRRLLSEADDQDATFLGSLEELAESGATVVLETTVDRVVRGHVRALAADHVVVVSEHGTAWVRLSAITLLRLTRQSTVRAGGGERASRAAVPFADSLRSLVEERASVDIAFEGGASARGVAIAAGRDVLTLRNAATGERCLAHLQRAAVVLVHTA